MARLYKRDIKPAVRKRRRNSIFNPWVFVQCNTHRASYFTNVDRCLVRHKNMFCLAKIKNKTFFLRSLKLFLTMHPHFFFFIFF